MKLSKYQIYLNKLANNYLLYFFSIFLKNMDPGFHAEPGRFGSPPRPARRSAGRGPAAIEKQQRGIAAGATKDPRGVKWK